MSRAGTLPSPLAHIHPRHRTPDTAIFVTVGLGTILTVWLGLRYRPATAFALVGTIITILILVVYLATCVSVPLFYYRAHREEFHIGRHVVLALIPAFALTFPIWVQFVPAPAPS
jgi:amino acid transporter